MKPETEKETKEMSKYLKSGSVVVHLDPETKQRLIERAKANDRVVGREAGRIIREGLAAGNAAQGK